MYLANGSLLQLRSGGIEQHGLGELRLNCMVGVREQIHRKGPNPALLSFWMLSSSLESQVRFLRGGRGQTGAKSGKHVQLFFAPSRPCEYDWNPICGTRWPQSLLLPCSYARRPPTASQRCMFLNLEHEHAPFDRSPCLDTFTSVTPCMAVAFSGHSLQNSNHRPRQ